MILQIICTIFLLYISVIKCTDVDVGGDSMADSMADSEYLKKISLAVPNRPEFNQDNNQYFRQVQIIVLRQTDQINRMYALLSELFDNFNEVKGYKHDKNKFKREQTRQGKLLKELASKLNGMNEEQNLQWNVLNSMMIQLYNQKQDQKQIQNQSEPVLEPIVIGGSCIDFLNLTHHTSGIYSIIVAGFSQLPFKVSCDQATMGGGWITVLRRQDGSVNFYRDWEGYKRGFGNLDGEYFIGLEKLHHLTKAGDQELLITMENFNGTQKYARYDQFAIATEQENYKLAKLGNYTGNAGDDMRYHRGRMFSARDRDNDEYSGNCAESSLGGWWYGMCHQSNLMGAYNETRYAKGINWHAFSGRKASLKAVRMLIRTKSINR